jgi:hypothetical protein
VCICVCVFDIFVPTAALIDEPPRLLETIPFGHPYQPVHIGASNRNRGFCLICTQRRWPDQVRENVVEQLAMKFSLDR